MKLRSQMRVILPYLGILAVYALLMAVGVPWLVRRGQLAAAETGAGFNPTSLWGLCHRLDTIGRRVGMTSPVMSETGEFIGWRRLRDWLRLLGFEIEAGQFGCYRPPFASQGWLDRSAWWDQAGERWWPVLGSVYLLTAVKRVRAMRLLGPEWKRKRRAGAAPAVVARRDPHTD